MLKKGDIVCLNGVVLQIESYDTVFSMAQFTDGTKAIFKENFLTNENLFYLLGYELSKDQELFYKNDFLYILDKKDSSRYLVEFSATGIQAIKLSPAQINRAIYLNRLSYLDCKDIYPTCVQEIVQRNVGRKLDKSSGFPRFSYGCREYWQEGGRLP